MINIPLWIDESNANTCEFNKYPQIVSGMCSTEASREALYATGRLCSQEWTALVHCAQFCRGIILPIKSEKLFLTLYKVEMMWSCQANKPDEHNSFCIVLLRAVPQPLGGDDHGGVDGEAEGKGGRPENPRRYLQDCKHSLHLIILWMESH